MPSIGASLPDATAALPEVSVEDLLRRAPVHMNAEAVRACMSEKTVLVTGAGGSIGSELCRQIMVHHPRKVLLFGHGEDSIHRIAGELLSKYPGEGCRLEQIIGDIRDASRLEHLFAQERPEIVIHAAAHKHVPLMELNPAEAVKNNVGGTSTVARMAGRYGAERFLFVSTDKAVNPTSVMGATKFVCEEVVRHMAVEFPDTRFITTRFGNVLGSRGSVVPLFREQIANGGPVTVTHPKMTRFFMTIPEAAELVLTALAVGESGRVIVLDMGEPVAITDLAREMIRLAGLEENVDIRIAYTGLRPGEKLFEELFGAGEERQPTPHPGLLTAKRPQYLTPECFREFVAELLIASEHWDQDRVCGILAREIPSLRGTVEELPLPLGSAA
jgi:FlaA1/EpsC-like NDP-sugar epimerase